MKQSASVFKKQSELKPVTSIFKTHECDWNGCNVKPAVWFEWTSFGLPRQGLRRSFCPEHAAVYRNDWHPRAFAQEEILSIPENKVKLIVALQ